MPVDSIGSVTVLVFTAACALSDIVTGKIFNSLIICGFMCAAFSRFCLALGTYAGYTSNTAYRPFYAGESFAAAVLADGAAGMIIPFVLLGALAALKMIGGGDVKLLSVLGLHFGLRGGLRIACYSLAAAAVCSAVLMLRRGNFVQRMNYFMRYLGKCVRNGHAGPYRQEAGDSSGEFCMAASIYAGLIIYCIST